MTKPPPARVVGFLARQAPVVALLRRGPTGWCRLVRWDLATGEVTGGDWLKGGVAQHTCDLSPDGERFVYRASYAWLDAEHAGIWTGLCVPPSLRTIVRWERLDSWRGGGLFADDDTLELNDVATGAVPRIPDGLRVTGSLHTDPDAVRLQRGGWLAVVGCADDDKFDGGWLEVWRKPASNAAAIELTRGREHRHHFTRFAVVRADGQRVELDGVTWADVDHDGRVIGADRGRLFVASRDELPTFEVVADLNEMVPPTSAATTP